MRNDDVRILRDIEQYYSTQIDEMCADFPILIACLCLCELASPTSFLSSFTFLLGRPMNVADLI